MNHLLWCGAHEELGIFLGVVRSHTQTYHSLLVRYAKEQTNTNTDTMSATTDIWMSHIHFKFGFNCIQKKFPMLWNVQVDIGEMTLTKLVNLACVVIYPIGRRGWRNRFHNPRYKRPRWEFQFWEGFFSRQMQGTVR